MSNQEASQRVRIAQTRAGLLEREKKYREVRWKSASKVLRDVLTSQGVSIRAQSHSLLITDSEITAFQHYQTLQQEMSIH
jgi:hypothetical protein